MDSKRWRLVNIRAPPRYVPPTKPLSFHQNIFQGTVHRQKIFNNVIPNNRENVIYHRDAFQPIANVIITHWNEDWPILLSATGKRGSSVESIGWIIVAAVCVTMCILAYGSWNADDVKAVKKFESSLVGRVSGVDLMTPKKR